MISDLRFLIDRTYLDPQQSRQIDQEIFDEVFHIIDQAERFVVLDMFLYNRFQGKEPETTRQLSDELTDHLVKARERNPLLDIVVISDEVNTVYGGINSPHFDRLAEAGIEVVLTDLDQLRDSNPCYSLPWRILIRPFGTGPGKLLPNPFGEGRVSIRSWLKLINFKANHRKVLIADQGDTVVGLVTSSNPHDGSSAHRNIAVKISGEAALDLLATEQAVVEFSGGTWPELDLPAVPTSSGPYQVQIATENQIKQQALNMITEAQAGDEIVLVMFYLADRNIVKALKQASLRGVAQRVLLDPNKDAFGWEKNGIPNRQVARELVKAGIPVRWCDTHGEQCHSKTLLLSRKDGRSTVLTGSANYTRRNLDNFNLETNVLVTADSGTAAITELFNHLNTIWSNGSGQRYSAPYERYADHAVVKRVLYRFQEASGMSTF